MADEDVRALPRLRTQWRARREDEALTERLATTLARVGHLHQARTVLEQAVTAGAQLDRIASLASRLATSTWWGRVGAGHRRAWLGAISTDTPKIVWTWTSPWTDDRFGLPACVMRRRLVLVAQSVVVGMRFVRLVALDLNDGSVAWEHERRNVMGPTGAFPIGGRSGRPQSVGWASTVVDEGGVELRVEVFETGTGDALATHRHTIEGAHMVSASTSPVVLDESRLVWPIQWVDEVSRHDGIVIVDRETGTIDANHLRLDLALSADTLSGRPTGLIAVGRDGVLDVELSSRRSVVSHLRARFSPPPDVTWYAEDRYEPDLAPAPGGWYVVAPVYETDGESARRHGELCWLPGASGAPLMPVGEKPRRHRVAAVRGDGVALVTSGPRGEARQLGLARNGVWSSVIHRFDAPIGRVVTMGAQAVVGLSRDDGGTEIAALDLPSGLERWRVRVGRRFHACPVPFDGGFLGIAADGVSCFSALST